MPRHIAAGILVGPTAVGKSAVAQWIAEHTGLPILSADSMLVYRGMDIGTAKPTPAERGDVPYFGMDLADPSSQFSTGAWLSAARDQLATFPSSPPPSPLSTFHSPLSTLHSPLSTLHSPLSTFPKIIVAGGTGLYVKALLDGLDAPPPGEASRTKWRKLFEDGGLATLKEALAERPDAMALLPPGDALNPRRIIRALERADANPAPIQPRDDSIARPRPVAGLIMPRDRLAARIMERIHTMFANGLLEEASALRSSGGLSETAAAAIGYAEALAVVDGRMTVVEAKERVAARTRQLAKRQMTWFRHQLAVEWIEVGEEDSPAMLGEKALEIWKRNGLREITI